MSGIKKPLEVLVFGRTGFVGSFVFSETRITIGRHSESMVRLEDPLVSLKHAELFLDGAFFRIRDVGSRTGTRVNGSALLPRQPVLPTDEISIGPFRLRATLCEPDAVEGPVSRESQRPQLDTIPTMPPPAGSAEATSGDFEPERPSVTDRPSDAPTEIRHVDRDEILKAAIARRPAAGRSTEASPRNEANAPRSPLPPPSKHGALPSPAAPPARHVPPATPSPPPVRQVAPPVPPPPVMAAPPKSAPKPPPTAIDAPSPAPPAALAAATVHVEKSPAPPALAFAIGDDPLADDEDDEDDANFVPSFDLLAELSQSGVREDTTSGRELSLEVIHYRADRVIKVRHLRAAGPVQLPGMITAIGALEEGGVFSLYPDACGAFSIRRDGRTLTSAEAQAERTGAKLRLKAGTQAVVDLGPDDKLLVQWVPRVQELKAPALSFKPTAGGMGTGALSVALHIAILSFIGLVVLGGKAASEAEVNAGRFVTIDMKELELEPPPPPPAPEVEVADTRPILKAGPQPKQEHSRVVVASKGAKTAAPDSPPGPTASTQRILSALGGAPSTLGAISVTNLDALPVGAGDFKVSGTVGKAPGDTLRIAAAGSSGPEADTKSASELGGNSLGRVQARASSGTVRARVTTAPQTIRGEGHLDRGEIQKVVNAHLYQVQGCYERQLAKDPSLSGKISFDWVVESSGGVSNVRIGRSTVHSVEATTCIQAAIQGWKFPAPQGGSVTVTYPFAFSALGG